VRRPPPTFTSLTTFQSRSQRSCRSPEHFHNLKALIRGQANEGEEERVAAADLELRAIRGRKRTLSAVLSHTSGSAQRPMALENDQQSSKRARIETDMLLKDAHGPRTAQQSNQLLSVQRRAENLHEACTYCESKANEPDSPSHFQVCHDRGEGRSPRVSCRTLSTLGQTASGHPGARITRQEPIRLAPGTCARAMACRTRGSNAAFHVAPFAAGGATRRQNASIEPFSRTSFGRMPIGRRQLPSCLERAETSILLRRQRLDLPLLGSVHRNQGGKIRTRPGLPPGPQQVSRIFLPARRAGRLLLIQYGTLNSRKRGVGRSKLRSRSRQSLPGRPSLARRRMLKPLVTKHAAHPVQTGPSFASRRSSLKTERRPPMSRTRTPTAFPWPQSPTRRERPFLDRSRQRRLAGNCCRSLLLEMPRKGLRSLPRTQQGLGNLPLFRTLRPPLPPCIPLRKCRLQSTTASAGTATNISTNRMLLDFTR
jgi:hypothetical protein